MTTQSNPGPAKTPKQRRLPVRRVRRVRLTVWCTVVWSTTLTCEVRHGGL